MTTTNGKNRKARTARKAKEKSARKTVIHPPEGAALSRILAEQSAEAPTTPATATILPFSGAKPRPNAS